MLICAHRGLEQTQVPACVEWDANGRAPGQLHGWRCAPAAHVDRVNDSKLLTRSASRSHPRTSELWSRIRLLPLCPRLNALTTRFHYSTPCSSDFAPALLLVSSTLTLPYSSLLPTGSMLSTRIVFCLCFVTPPSLPLSYPSRTATSAIYHRVCCFDVVALLLVACAASALAFARTTMRLRCFPIICRFRTQTSQCCRTRRIASTSKCIDSIVYETGYCIYELTKAVYSRCRIPCLVK